MTSFVVSWEGQTGTGKGQAKASWDDLCVWCGVFADRVDNDCEVLTGIKMLRIAQNVQEHKRGYFCASVSRICQRRRGERETRLKFNFSTSSPPQHRVRVQSSECRDEKRRWKTNDQQSNRQAVETLQSTATGSLAAREGIAGMECRSADSTWVLCVGAAATGIDKSRASAQGRRHAGQMSPTAEGHCSSPSKVRPPRL